MPTIRDVAKLAGVSTATVSHVLNNSRTVLPETRQQVLHAIEQLNYRPSAIARSLTTNVTRTIAVLVADITNPFFASIVRGIEDRLEPHGLNLIVCNTDEQADREARYLELLLARRVDGLIIAPTGEAQTLFHEFASHRIPLVFIDRKPPHPHGPLVAVDNHAIGYAATNYLLRLGHRRIAILARKPMLSTVMGRLGGYRQAFIDHRLTVDESLIAITEHDLAAVANSARQLLASNQHPTAIIATNQIMSLGVLQAMQDRHLKCPDDISLICFDDNPWVALFTPPLTAVRQPVAELCDAAINTLQQALTHQRSKSVEKTILPDVLLKAELIQRASCKSI
ncbi:MAG: LacI family DNA-binding transcriptional regulator [Chloroflexi bacterium]|nr:LacI family DNA-binding transcriptional regulator [Chloroflexota bacterium]